MKHICSVLHSFFVTALTDERGEYGLVSLFFLNIFCGHIHTSYFGFVSLTTRSSAKSECGVYKSKESCQG